MHPHHAADKKLENLQLISVLGGQDFDFDNGVEICESFVGNEHEDEVKSEVGVVYLSDEGVGGGDDEEIGDEYDVDDACRDYRTDLVYYLFVLFVLLLLEEQEVAHHHVQRLSYYRKNAQ